MESLGSSGGAGDIGLYPLWKSLVKHRYTYLYHIISNNARYFFSLAIELLYNWDGFED